MPSTRELRRRIKSIRSTKQITKALELVSASKMRRATQATLASRPYAETAWEVLRDLAERPGVSLTHPLLVERPVKKVLVIIISSDSGLAGAYDPSVLRTALKFAKEQKAEGRTIEFIAIGKKAQHSLLGQGYTILQSYPNKNNRPATKDILPISSFAIHSFKEGDYDQVMLISTRFHSILRQETTLEQVLPLRVPEHAKKNEKPLAATELTYEPTPETVLETLLPRLVEVQIYQSLLESLASEHSSRRMAMKNATDNASSVIDDLTLTYNGLRQSAITQELAEITSGAATLAN